MSVQDYTTTFDNLTLRCELQEDCRHAISRFRSGDPICSVPCAFTPKMWPPLSRLVSCARHRKLP